MVASLIFIVLLRFLAGVMVWVMIVMVILVLGYGEPAVRGFPVAFPRFPFPIRSGIGTKEVRTQRPTSTSASVGSSRGCRRLGLRFYDNFRLFAAGIFHCYMEYAKLKGEAGSDVSLKDLGFQTDLRVYLHLRQTWLAFSKSPSCPGRGVGQGDAPQPRCLLGDGAWEGAPGRFGVFSVSARPFAKG